MLLRAAEAIAHVVKDEELNPNFIIPSVFHPDVPKAVAAAIRGTARLTVVCSRGACRPVACSRVSRSPGRGQAPARTGGPPSAPSAA